MTGYLNERDEIDDQTMTAIVARIGKTTGLAVGSSGRDRERYHLEIFLAAEDLGRRADALRLLAAELVTHANDVIEGMDSRDPGSGGGSI